MEATAISVQAAGGGPSETATEKSSTSSKKSGRFSGMKARSKGKPKRTTDTEKEPDTLNLNKDGAKDGGSSGELGFAADKQLKDVSGEVQAIKVFKKSIASATSPSKAEGIQFYAPAICRRVLFEAAAKLVSNQALRRSALDARKALDDSIAMRDAQIKGKANADRQLEEIESRLKDLNSDLSDTLKKQNAATSAEHKAMLEMEADQILKNIRFIRSTDNLTQSELANQRDKLEKAIAYFEEMILIQERAEPIKLDKTIQFCLSLKSPGNYNFTKEQAEEVIGLLQTSGGALPKVIPKKGCVSTEIVSNISTNAITDEKKVLEALHETFALKIMQNEGFTAAEGMIKDIDAMIGRMTTRVKQLQVKQLKTQEAKKEAMLSRANLIRADNPLITIIHNLNLIVGAELDVPTVTNIIGVPVCGATKTIYDEWVRRRGGSTLTSQDLFDLFEPDLSNAQLRFNNASLVKAKEEKEDDET